MTKETVSAIVHVEEESYAVWAPFDLADQLSHSVDGAWVSLALIKEDEYICLRAKDIVLFRRDMTAAEKQRRHTPDLPYIETS